MKDFWDERYSTGEYVYGLEPNAFFKQSIDKINPGIILLPYEGEGQNAVYAAQKGWKVVAFDQNPVARNKALHLAKTNKVEIEYVVTSVEDFYTNLQFDVIALIYAHFPSFVRRLFHHRFGKFLNSEGVVILEAFNKKQLDYKTGGPPLDDLLYNEEWLRSDFRDLHVEYIQEHIVDISRGPWEGERAAVIRMLARN
jgi:hypothetical protein